MQPTTPAASAPPPAVAPHELRVDFNLKGRFMLAVICLVLHRVAPKEPSLHFSRGSLGSAVLGTRSFFQDFSFKFVRLQSETNSILSRVYTDACSSDNPSLMNHIEGNALLVRHSSLVELLENFQVEEV